MKRSSASLVVAALALGWFAGAQARADFDYTATPTTPLITPDTSSSSAIFLQSTGGTVSGSSGGTINLAQAIIVSFASPGNPSTFTDKAFSVGFTLKDDTSGQTTSFTATGSLSGTANNGAAQFTLQFNTPSAPLTATLGGNTYTVSLATSPTAFPVAPGLPGFSGFYIGNIQASVTESSPTPPPPPPPPPPPQNAPEPSTLLLACLGLSSLYLASLRKRRRHVVVV